MNPFRLPMRMLSEAFWQQVDFMTGESLRNNEESLRSHVNQCDELLKTAKYKTGSITWEQCKTLYCLSHYFQPQTLVEVGTYIGRSTISLYLGSHPEIWTCDKDHDCFVHPEIKTHKTTSAELLKKIEAPVDMFFFDGRISPEEVSIIHKLSHDKTVYLFDDFEGVEKGVVNALFLMTGDRFLIYPKHGIAVMFKGESLVVTRQ